MSWGARPVKTRPAPCYQLLYRYFSVSSGNVNRNATNSEFIALIIDKLRLQFQAADAVQYGSIEKSYERESKKDIPGHFVMTGLFF